MFPFAVLILESKSMGMIFQKKGKTFENLRKNVKKFENILKNSMSFHAIITNNKLLEWALSCQYLLIKNTKFYECNNSQIAVKLFPTKT